MFDIFTKSLRNKLLTYYPFKSNEMNKKRLHHHIQQTGFTLIEVLLTLGILATVITMAVPSFINIFQSWEAKEIRSQITEAIRTAKSHSFSQRQNSIMCLADANLRCHKSAKTYLVVFTDSDDNHHFDKGINQMVLQQRLHLDYGRLYLRAGQRDYIKFFGDSGLPRGHFGHIKYCSNDRLTNNMYQISLNQQGNQRFKPYSVKKTGCP
ncbi:prepilin-type N-terminal cleavage/methylation domain-containing protein [Psychrobacter sp.]|uniref:pilus assembly FimT family protein n=1 Tax=Psychrobacter sp. TaxID=56811 RepID=UPI0025EE9D25|nr:prepilin-type N-terminal cleavage/methylation domain-containing protein [Psychrobacter sp.]